MSPRLVPPSSPGRLARLLGPNAVEVRIDGQLIPNNRHASLTMRRARSIDDPIGNPASCSLSVSCDTPPSWRKGSTLDVQLSAAALSALIGDTRTRRNLVSNPSFEVDLTGWAQSGATSLGQTRVDKTTALGAATAPYYYPGGGWLCQLTWPTMAARAHAFQTVVSGLVVGQRYRASAMLWQKATAAPKAFLRISKGASAIVEGNQVTTPDAAMRSRVEFTATATTATLQVLPAAATTAGQQLLIDTVILEDLRTAPTEALDSSYDRYFDGGLSTVSGWTPSWTGTPHASPSIVTTDATGEKNAARYRFKGTVQDVELVAKATGPATARVIATGTTAGLGRLIVGAKPWPRDALFSRAEVILAAALDLDPSLSALNYGSSSRASGHYVETRDVDSTSVQALLEELAREDGTMMLTEMRSGTLLWAPWDLNPDSGITGRLELTPRQIRQPLSIKRQGVVNDVTVVYGPARGPLAGEVVAYNHCTNPGAEVDLTGWTVSVGGTLTRDTAVKLSGAAAFRVTANNPPTTNTLYMSHSTYTPIGQPGERVAARFAGRTSRDAQPLRVEIWFKDAAGTVFSKSGGPSTISTAGSWHVVGHSAVAPAGAVSWTFIAQQNAAADVAGRYVVFDNLRGWVIEDQGDDTVIDFADYFDGDTTADDAYTYAWSPAPGGAPGKAVSWRVSTGRAPRPAYRLVDQASVAANGRSAVKVDTTLDDKDSLEYRAAIRDRASYAMRSSPWTPPTVSSDVLALLEDGDGDQLRGGDLFAARALAQAELGARVDLTELPAHIGTTHTGYVCDLSETITPHGWSITLESETIT